MCSVQNGVGNEEILAEHVRYVIRGTTFPAGHPVAPGHIGYDIKGDTWIGPFEPTQTPMSRVEELAGLMTRSGMNTIALQDARGAQWTKLIFNASTNPVGALTLLHHGAATRFAPTGTLFNDLIAEGEAVAKALGIELHGDPRHMVQKGANAPGKHRASMLQDVLAKRQTEVDFMNGAIARWGEQAGVPTPLNQAALGTDQGTGAFLDGSGVSLPSLFSDRGVHRTIMTIPFNIGVLQLSMEPVRETVAMATACEQAGFDAFWIAEAYPWWRKHSFEARSSTAVLAVIAAANQPDPIGVGHHLALHAASRPNRHGSTRDAGPCGGSLHARVGSVQDFHEGDRRG